MVASITITGRVWQSPTVPKSAVSQAPELAFRLRSTVWTAFAEPVRSALVFTAANRCPAASPLRLRWSSAMVDPDRTGVAVQEVHITRSVRECAWRPNPVPNVLDAFGRVARDHAAGSLVIKAERGNSVVLTVKDARVAVRRRGGQPAKPPTEREPVLVHEPGQRWGEAQLHCASKVRIGKGIDL